MTKETLVLAAKTALLLSEHADRLDELEMEVMPSWVRLVMKESDLWMLGGDLDLVVRDMWEVS